MKAREIACSAIIAAIYCTVTLAFAPISFGPIQIRFAEMLVILCAYRKNSILGTTMGCFISNLFSPLGIIDVVFGCPCTLVICLYAYKTKNVMSTIVCGALLTGVVVGIELYAVYGTNFIYGFLGAAIGEVIALSLGALVMASARKGGNVECRDQEKR